MKNLNEFGVQEMNFQEIKNVEGGRIPLWDDLLDCFYEFGEGFKKGWKSA